jgi:hypothetical protein
MVCFLFFISTFLLSAFGGERLGESATRKDAATTANAPIYALLPNWCSWSRHQAGRHAHQRQQGIPRRGAEEFAPAFNLLGQYAHSKVVEI